MRTVAKYNPVPSRTHTAVCQYMQTHMQSPTHAGALTHTLSRKANDDRSDDVHTNNATSRRMRKHDERLRRVYSHTHTCTNVAHGRPHCTINQLAVRPMFVFLLPIRRTFNAEQHEPRGQDHPTLLCLESARVARRSVPAAGARSYVFATSTVFICFA